MKNIIVVLSAIVLLQLEMANSSCNCIPPCSCEYPCKCDAKPPNTTTPPKNTSEEFNGSNQGLNASIKSPFPTIPISSEDVRVIYYSFNYLHNITPMNNIYYW